MKPAWMKGHIGVRFSSSLMACAGVVAVLFAQRPESSEELMRSSNGLMFIKPASNFRHMMSQAKKLPYKQENLYEGHEESISPGSLASKTPNFSAKGYWHQLQLHEQVQSQQLSRQHRCQRACGSWPECDCGICINTHTHTHTHIHTHTHTNTHTHTDTHTQTHKHTHAQTNTHTHTHTHNFVPRRPHCRTAKRAPEKTKLLFL